MLSWNYIEYTLRLQKEKWIEFVEELRNKKNEVFKITREFLQAKIEEYKEKNNEIKKSFDL